MYRALSVLLFTNDVDRFVAFIAKRCGQAKWNYTWKWKREQIGDNKIWYQNTAKA